MTDANAIFVTCAKVRVNGGADATHEVHRGVQVDLIAEGTGGSAVTVVRSTLTGDTWRVHPMAVWRLDGLDEDTVFGVLSGCRCL